MTDLVERATREMCDRLGLRPMVSRDRDAARAVVNLIIEECAKVAEASAADEGSVSRFLGALTAAARIRALKHEE